MKIPETLKWKGTGVTLGEGGQGVVQQVVNKEDQIGKTFALKALSTGKPAKAYERFYREIASIKQLDHPYIIKVIDHSEPDDTFNYYVMEYIEGAKPLGKLLNTPDNFFYGNVIKSLGLFSQVIRAILACDSIGVVHRDLSPSNILVLPDETIKVIDFGICQIEEYATVTLIDENIGTPNYRAPECEAGSDDHITSLSDVYSAGKILWSAITNQNAFARETPVFTNRSMRTVFPNSPETWHVHLVFEKTVRRNSNERWAPSQLLDLCTRIHNLVLSGYPPLEFIAERCPVCGFGKLQKFEQSHAVFGNPNPRGIVALQCSYCGYCFAINKAKINETLKSRESLD